MDELRHALCSSAHILQLVRHPTDPDDRGPADLQSLSRHRQGNALSKMPSKRRSAHACAPYAARAARMLC